MESVFLWIRKILPELAPEVREQIQKLLDDTHTEHTIASLYMLGDVNRRRLRLRQSGPWFVALMSKMGMLRVGIDDKTAENLREEHLQTIRVALNRLSGMLSYAADDLEELEESDDIYFAEHYAPQKVDRSRVSAVLQSLESQIQELPDEIAVKRSLLRTVEELKRESQRPRPRWRSFLGKAVILLAIIADVKTMHPEIGGEILRTIDAVIQTIVTGCQATQSGSSAKLSDDGPEHWAIEPKRLGYRRTVEENGDDET
jgi:hypothetical protein